jgi:hypothetical protein
MAITLYPNSETTAHIPYLVSEMKKDWKFCKCQHIDVVNLQNPLRIFNYFFSVCVVAGVRVYDCGSRKEGKESEP